ncbi:unnamed protein product [Nyctereutes procyonoides]|uniref:(raccoon dog) hypothetical protein n=1 Tax=Nyctereutes procyonoides TaxID=34880 RepID=A0A811Y072_NYCPR|nr:unnamed protein product [Nyctereutes procyonoides]
MSFLRNICLGQPGCLSGLITNDLGRKFILRLCPTEKEITELLNNILSGNNLALEALAKVVHQGVTFTDPTLDSVEIFPCGHQCVTILTRNYDIQIACYGDSSYMGTNIHSFQPLSLKEKSACKNLCVIQGLLDISIFPEDTAFQWDFCAAHATLRAMGGTMRDLKECLQKNPEMSLTCHINWCANKEGLIAYRLRKWVESFLNLPIKNPA